MEKSGEVLKKINDGEYTIKERKGRSIIWACFFDIQKGDGSILEGSAYCRVCHKIYKYEKNQTSNLLKHKCVHSRPHDIELIEVSNTDKNACFKVFMDFTIEDCRPVSMFDGSGFRKMIAKCIKIGAKYGENVDLDKLIPSARALSQKSKLMAEEKKREMSPHIQYVITNDQAAVTIDMWTDDFIKRNFLCATLHFQMNFELVDITLGIKSMDFESNTAVNIKRKLNSLFDEFGVTDLSNVIFVTDRGSNIVSALKDFTRVNCSAHEFSNVLSDAFESTQELKEITQDCKKIVKYCKKANKQHMLNTTLESYYPTKWNSNFTMFKSIFDNCAALNEILADDVETRDMLILNMIVLQSLVEICNDFEIIFKKLQSRTSSTFCFVIPSINKIRTICNAQNNDEPAISAFKNNILLHLQKWNSNLSILHKIALFLYPPAISLQLKELDDIKQFCVNKLKENQNDILPDNYWFSGDQNESTNMQELHTPETSNLTNSSFTTNLEEPTGGDVSFFFPTLTIKSETGLETERNEVERYCNECIRLTDEFDVMLWWKNNSGKYPRLSKLATKLLSIPATSATSERVFSLAGNIMSEKRNLLDPKTVDSILFLNSLHDKAWVKCSE